MDTSTALPLLLSLVVGLCLGVLVGALKRVRAGGGTMRLVCHQPHVLRLLHMTGLDEVFVIVASRGRLPETLEEAPLLGRLGSTAPDARPRAQLVRSWDEAGEVLRDDARHQIPIRRAAEAEPCDMRRLMATRLGHRDGPSSHPDLSRAVHRRHLF